jgi:hypothetical protein
MIAHDAGDRTFFYQFQTFIWICAVADNVAKAAYPVDFHIIDQRKGFRQGR